MAKKNRPDPAEFWRQYEAGIGEKVLAFGMGQYVSGWREFDRALWGLIIATEGGFRFHHFPQESWLQALSRTTSGGDRPTEKTLFIPRERILSAEFVAEKSLLKRLFFYKPPLAVIRYQDGEGNEGTFVAETDEKGGEVIRMLNRS